MKELIQWFEENRRPLPWRDTSTTPWGILVSEVMLQQTPAARVEPVWRQWMERWPTPAHLAHADNADVLHAWGRLGYPRRALRLHEAAQHIESEYGGTVPSDEASLRSIPGIGEYTAAAVRAFAFSRPAVVLDVNIRRVLTRVCLGEDLSRSSISRSERELASRALQEADNDPQWNAAIMEFGALVCTARNPLCSECPIATSCAWKAAGYPEPASRPRTQAWIGTDRQIRGKIMAYLRAAPGYTAGIDEFLALWHNEAQARNAVVTLSDDGLIHESAPGIYMLGGAASSL